MKDWTMQNPLLLLSFGFWAISISVFAQIDNAPFKDANTIILKTDSSQSANFRLVIDQLLSNGYELADEKKEFGTVKSGTKSIPGISGIYYLYFVCREKEILVSGQFKMNSETNLSGVVIQPAFEQIQYKRMKISAHHRAFLAMEDLCKRIGPTLSYSKL